MGSSFSKPQLVCIADVPSDWKEDVRYVYIGREGKGETGEFGNPCRKGAKCPQCGGVHATPGSTIPCYIDYLNDRVREDSVFAEAVRGLEGRLLVCFCRPGDNCHGIALAAMCEHLNSL